jgi:biotin synthase-related radical SAM superfamily protein
VRWPFFSIIAKRRPTEEYSKNPFSVQQYREEDSPGNYAIELKDGMPTYFYFDENGKKIELGAIGKGASTSSF